LYGPAFRLRGTFLLSGIMTNKNTASKPKSLSESCLIGMKYSRLYNNKH
jgi:hypothetical protein